MMKIPLRAHLCLAGLIGLLGATPARAAQAIAKVWVTSADLRQTMTEQTPLRFARDLADAGMVIEVDSRLRHQTMLGLGASLEASTCHNLSQLSPADQRVALARLVSPAAGIGMNLMRVSIGTSDFTGDPWYSYDDLPAGGADPELKHFSIAKDRAYILPILKLARSQNPELLFFASPWSPPGWMKSTGSLIGGYLLPGNYAAYAEYFVRFIQAYEAEGIPIYAVTVQNEPGVDRAKEKDPKWFYPSCKWTGVQERDFIRDHLGPAFRRHGLKTRIWIYDHNYNVWPSASGEDAGLEYPRTILSDSRAAACVAGTAFHGYVGDPSGMTRFHREFPRTPVHFTEGSVFGPQGAVDLAERLRNAATSYNAWVTVLDEGGKPNNGPFPATHAIVKYHAGTGQLEYLHEYFVYGQFMKYVRRGAARIHSSDGLQSFSNVAFRNPDGAIVIVVANAAKVQRDVTIRHRGEGLRFALGAESVATLTWRE